jgi:hypothetical protein
MLRPEKKEKTDTENLVSSEKKGAKNNKTVFSSHQKKELRITIIYSVAPRKE